MAEPGNDPGLAPDQAIRQVYPPAHQPTSPPAHQPTAAAAARQAASPGSPPARQPGRPASPAGPPARQARQPGSTPVRQRDSRRSASESAPPAAARLLGRSGCLAARRDQGCLARRLGGLMWSGGAAWLARPDPARRGPTLRDPARRGATRRGPTRPDPTRRDPARPNSARPGVARPSAARPDVPRSSQAACRPLTLVGGGQRRWMVRVKPAGFRVSISVICKR